MRHHASGVRSVALLLLFAALLSRPLYAQNQNTQQELPVSADLGLSASSGTTTMHHPREDRLRRGKPFHGDLRTLPQARPQKFERLELEEPELNPIPFPGASPAAQSSASAVSSAPVISAPAPSPGASFEGLDFTNWGATGLPPLRVKAKSVMIQRSSNVSYTTTGSPKLLLSHRLPKFPWLINVLKMNAVTREPSLLL